MTEPFPSSSSVKLGSQLTGTQPEGPRRAGAIDAQWFTVDTDGSVLAATTEDPTRFYDCEVPSGACEQIGQLRMTGGDPMFIGNDM